MHILTKLKMTLSNYGYYVEPATLSQLIKAKERVLKLNADRLILIDGREGTGKTTLALQMAYVLDPTFCLEDIVFTADDFEKRVHQVGRFKAIVFDEAFNGLSNRAALSNINRKLVKLLMECRQKNLFIFIVLPSMFLLEKYVALFRSHVLFHVYSSIKNPERRYFKTYNYQNKKLLYLKGKEMLSYSEPKIWRSCRFYNVFPKNIDQAAYIAKKLAAFGGSTAKVVDPKVEKAELEVKNLKKMIANLRFPIKNKSEFCKALPVDLKTFNRWAKSAP